MKNKKILLLSAAALTVVAIVVGLFFVLRKDTPQVNGTSELFYENDLATTGADPDVIYITEGKDAGY